jgi:hypothetical protein
MSKARTRFPAVFRKRMRIDIWYSSGAKYQIQLLSGINKATDNEWIVIKPYFQSLIGKEIFSIEKGASISKRVLEGNAKI